MEEQSGVYYGDENVCKQCGVRTIDRSENPHSVLCGECRQELTRLKIPGFIYAALGALMVLVGVAVYFFLPVLEDYAIFENAAVRADSGHPAAVLEGLYELNERYPASQKIAIRSADIGMKYYFYDYAGYAIDTYLAGESVDEAVYDRISGYQDRLDIYYTTLDLLTELDSVVVEEMEAGERSEEAILTDYRDQIAAFAETGGYEQGILCYLAGLYSMDAAEQIYWLERALTAEPLYYLVEAELANAYRRQGDFDKAWELLNHAYRIDCDDAATRRSLAVMEMLDGSAEKALEYAKTAYEEYPEGTYVADTYIVALYFNNMPAEAAKLKEEWEAKEYFFDEDMTGLLAGEMTVEDYYVGE